MALSQTAPPTFGWAAITLGIGPNNEYILAAATVIKTRHVQQLHSYIRHRHLRPLFSRPPGVAGLTAICFCPVFLRPPCVADAGIIFCCCGYFPHFFLSFFLAYSERPEVRYHTSTHDVALVRIYNAGLKCAACGSLEI